MTVARASAGSVGKPGVTGRAVARAWRELTGGTGRDRDLERRTLIACSGGGDSSGLVLTLASAVTRAREVFVVGHVVHDMRTTEEALADRDAARALAERVGLPFVEGRVWVRREGGNLEAAARRLRYAELGRLAAEAGCRYIATAHHAEDQLETMLMALVRGAGVRGLSGIAPKRRVGGSTGRSTSATGGRPGTSVIRPALGLSRKELRRVCKEAGWEWRDDATNQDRSRLRAAIRATVVEELERLRPGAAKRAGRAALVVRGAAKVVREQAAVVMCAAKDGEELWWEKGALRGQPEVVLGEVLRLAAKRLADGRGADRMSASALGRVVRAIKDRGTEPREFAVGGLVVELTARRVTIKKASGMRLKA